MRLFVAVDIGGDVREKLRKPLSEIAKLSGVKAVELENLHITLLFLGEVPEAKVPQITQRLSEISFEPFEIRIKGVGAFPNERSPRVVWAGVEDGGKLKRLADEVYDKLRRMGFRRDKEFSAHVTLGRIKRRNEEIKKFLEAYRDEDFGSMLVDRFKLKQSILRQQGPIYKDITVFEA
ncbi:MAG: RNA 2',3'-cyclic phosphodiesterase [Archaeoglobaceae archaeon]